LPLGFWGYNDMVLSGVSARVAANRTWTWHDTMHAAGFRTVACTPFEPAGQLPACAGFVRAEYAAHADALVDLAADPRLSAPSNTTYYQYDGVHLTPAGYQVVADAVKAAVGALAANPRPALTAPPSGTTVASDSFTGAGGTALTAHTLDTGQSWEFVGGNMVTTLQGDGTVHAAADDWYLTNGRFRDHTSQFDFKLDDGNGYAIPLFRACSGSNFWALYVMGSTYGSGLSLYQFTGGTPTVRVSGSWAFDTNWHTVKVVCSGTTVTAFLDGVQKIQYGAMGFNLNTVQCGFRLMGAAARNFSVKTS
jgi:hypothetical protein